MSLNITPENLCSNKEQCLSELEECWDTIPSLNCVQAHNVPHQSLVRFSGMIQDMRSPEFYLEEYEVVNRASGAKSRRHAKYVDVNTVPENEELNFEEEKRSERQSYIVISTPALNKWVEALEEKKNCNSQPTSRSSPVKRPIEEDEEMEVEGAEAPAKKLCTQGNQGGGSAAASSALAEHNLSFPLESRIGRKCEVIVYDDYEQLKLNDVVELVGFISFNPVSQASDEEEQNSFGVIRPPPSLVPRIHCISYKKLSHNNLLVNPTTSMPPERMQFLKKELLIVLTQLLLGDTLAADYLLCNLVSEVYMRPDFLALGKFSLNVSNVPQLPEIDYPESLYEFVEMLVPKSHYLPMTLENMNDLQFVPKKDYDTDNLHSGVLQLSANTHLVLDETKLSPGKLNAGGVNNLRALAGCIKSQQLSYDFKYYPVDYNCDIPFLILSEGKSMLTPDCHVVLQPEESSISTFQEIVQAAKHFLNPQLLDELRVYLTMVRLGKFEISDGVQELVQQEFVRMRQQDQGICADDLHSLLVLARLVCITEGKTTLDDVCWMKACEMERQRKARIVK